MSSDGFAIRVREVSKHYFLYARPQDRLKQSIVPRLQRAIGRAPAKYYREFAALNGVSFEVRRGETVGILGRNGSGKSTLLQIVCGTTQPSTGSVEVCGRVAALLELGAGFNADYTGRENVHLNAAILGLTRSEIERRFDAIAAFADIGEFIDQPVKTYSSGMYVRLAFATAINVDPDILVVDEALAVGDEAFQRKCFARIEEIQGRGGTILFVSHAPQTIVQLCSRALLIDGGELLLGGPPKLVTSQYQRLVNASAEAAAHIRADLRQAHGGEGRACTQAREPDASDVQAVPAHGAAEPRETWAGDHYDASVKSSTVVSLEERGATIRDVRLLTLNGAAVNCLQMGRRYILAYRVEFHVDAKHVGFGIFIRTPEGHDLAGAQTIHSRSLRTPSLDAGASANVEFEFTCALNPRTYFCTTGVFGTVGTDERIVMHRLIDAIAFRVLPQADHMATGFFDIGAVPRVTLA